MRRVLLTVSLLVSMAACAGATSESAVAKIPNATVAPVGTAAQAQGHSPVAHLAEALSRLPLQAAQRTEVESLLTAADARHAALKGGHAPVMIAFADQVEKGAIDRAALVALMNGAKAQHDGALSEDRAGLTRLHALLLPEQRAMLADSFSSRGDEGRGGGKHHGHHGGNHGKSENGKTGPEEEEKHGEGHEHDEGEEANAGEHQGMHHGRGHARGGHGMMGLLHMGQELALSDGQKLKIAEIVKAQREAQGPEAHENHRKAMRIAIEAFRSSTFDASAVLPKHDGATDMGERMIDLAEKIVPILTPEQRTKAAQMLRARAAQK
jgi:Spy/CpxP family protein refolding chaperone